MHLSEKFQNPITVEKNAWKFEIVVKVFCLVDDRYCHFKKICIDKTANNLAFGWIF